MSVTPPVTVTGCILIERPDGTRILDLSLKAGQLQLAFSAAQWALLGDSARWFHERNTNGISENSHEVKP